MRASSALWPALAIAVSLFASPLRAQVDNVAKSEYRIDRSAGALKEIAGSPFAAGDSPWSLAVDPSGKFVYVANRGGAVSGYKIDPSTGALRAIAGSPFAPGYGPVSVAVDPSGKFAYVVKKIDKTYLE
jgi:6-phosphogluconolactonase